MLRPARLRLSAPGGDPHRRCACGLAYGAGSIWTADYAGGTTTRIVATIAVGDGPSGLAVRGDEVWVADRGDGTIPDRATGAVRRIDPTAPPSRCRSA